MVGFGAKPASAGDEGKLSSVGADILLDNRQTTLYQSAWNCKYSSVASHTKTRPGMLMGLQVWSMKTTDLWKESCCYTPGYEIIW